MNKNSFKKRREHVLKQIGSSGIAILFSSKEQWRNKENYYTYRQDSDFYYLTGFKEPEAIAVLVPNRQEGEFILFNRERDPLQEVWHGKREGQAGATINYGADQAFPITIADSMLPQIINGRDRVYFNMDQETVVHIANWVEHLSNKRRSGVNDPTEFINISKITHEMREHKDSEEIAVMRKAAMIAAQAQIQAMHTCRPNIYEYELEAAILHECIKNGAKSQAFEPIIASGANSCILHYVSNDAMLKDGELVLVDIGAEYEFYASDITRTYPISGRFNEEQRSIYQAVLDTQLAVLKYIKPGVRWNEIFEFSEKVITEKLLELGLLKGKLEKLLADKSCKQFYMHNIGHWIGLDAHDVGWYKDKDAWRMLEPSMLMTVEPGIYISENIPNIDSKWRNIGVRIEDTVLITENGCEILTKDVPKTIDEIEQAMARR